MTANMTVSMNPTKVQVKWPLYILLAAIFVIPVILLVVAPLAPNFFFNIRTDRGRHVSLDGVTSVDTTSSLHVDNTNVGVCQTGANPITAALAGDVSTAAPRPTVWFWLAVGLLVGLVLITGLILFVSKKLFFLCCCNPQESYDSDCGPQGCVSYGAPGYQKPYGDGGTWAPQQPVSAR